MKKILFLAIDFPPMLGGMARHSHDVCAALRSAGYEVHVVAPGAGSASREVCGKSDVSRVNSVREGHIFDNYAFSVAAFFLRAFKSLVFGRFSMALANTWSVAGVAALLLKRLAGVPYIVFAHGLDVYAPRSSPKASRLMREVLEGASMVIANSRFTESLVEAVSEKVRVTVLNPTIDLSRFSSALANIQGRQGGEEKTILTVARLVESKGHDLVIRSLPEVITKFPDAVYRIAGDGPQAPALRRLANDLGVSAHVEFIKDADEERLAKLYRDCDLFIMTSREIAARGEVEGFGIVFLEAGAFSKPVIGSSSGGIPDAVVDGLNGILVDPARPGAVSDAIIRILSDAALAKSMGEAGRSRAEKDLGMEAFASGLKAIIEKVPAS